MHILYCILFILLFIESTDFRLKKTPHERSLALIHYYNINFQGLQEMSKEMSTKRPRYCCFCSRQSARIGRHQMYLYIIYYKTLRLQTHKPPQFPINSLLLSPHSWGECLETIGDTNDKLKTKEIQSCSLC